MKSRLRSVLAWPKGRHWVGHAGEGALYVLALAWWNPLFGFLVALGAAWSRQFVYALLWPALAHGWEAARWQWRWENVGDFAATMLGAVLLYLLLAQGG